MYTQIEKSHVNKGGTVANTATQKKSSKKQGFGLVDNRPEAITQRKSKEATSSGVLPLQLRTSKIVETSARKHYHDGWGAKYKIQNDTALEAKVPDSVKGSGEVPLGIYESGPRWFHKGEQYKKGKKCNILYKDVEEGWGKYKSKSTSIYHCGPTGPAITKKV